jgi:hypothetical protein
LINASIFTDIFAVSENHRPMARIWQSIANSGGEVDESETNRSAHHWSSIAALRNYFVNWERLMVRSSPVPFALRSICALFACLPLLYAALGAIRWLACHWIDVLVQIRFLPRSPFFSVLYAKSARTEAL